MKKIFMLLAVVLMTVAVSAQTLKQGKPIDDEFIADEYNKPIGAVDGNLFFFNIDAKELYLVKINKELNLESRKKINFELPAFHNLNAHIYNQKIYLLYSNLNLLSVSFKYAIFDLNGNILEDKDIGEIKGDFNITNNKFFSISPNGKFSSVVMSGRKGRSDDLSLIVMKIELGENVTSSEYFTEIDFKDYKVSRLERISINNNGKFIGIVEKRRGIDVLDTETELFVLDNKAKLLKRQEIAAKGYYLKEFMLNINQLNEVKMAGNYYSRKDKKFYLNGFFIANYNMEELEFENVNFKPLSGDILSIYGEPNKKGQYENFSGKFEVKNYNNDDGSGFLVAERISEPNFRLQMELIVIPYNQENVFENFVFVPKNQRYYVKPDINITYYAFTKNNHLNIYYNSDEKVINAKNAIYMNVMKSADSKKSRTFKCVINDESQKNLSVFANYETTDEYLNVEKCFTIDGVNVLTMMKDGSIIYGIFE